MSTIPSPNIVVYTENPVVTPATFLSLKNWVNNLPEGKQKTMLEKDLENTTLASDVAVSGFNTIIVGLFHVHDDGSIYYNDFPYNSDLAGYFYEAIAELRSAPGSKVETVLISFGGGGPSESDYTAMKAHWTTFKPQLLQMMKDMNADGVDWDYEVDPTEFDAAFITRITNEMAAENCLVTAAPFGNYLLSNWTAVIEGTVNEHGPGNSFAWWNLQLYGPDTDYPSWESALTANGVNTGMSAAQVQAFLAPGYEISGGGDSYAISDLTGQRGSYPSINGVFVWNFGSMGAGAPQVAGDLKNVF